MTAKSKKLLKRASIILLGFALVVGVFFTLWALWPPIDATTYKLSAVPDTAQLATYKGSYIKLYEDNKTFEIVIKQSDVVTKSAIGTYTKEKNIITFTLVDHFGTLNTNATISKNKITYMVDSMQFVFSN